MNDPVTFSNWPYPRLCAHRGAGKLAPENTLAAMRVGAAHGYRMFEFDVKLSGDGTLILMHDPTLERTTSGRGRVSARALGDLMKLDAGAWHSPAYAGEGIATLWRVGGWLLANDHRANIEIKPCPGTDAPTGAAVALEADLLWGPGKVPPLLSSFSETALAAARDARPRLPRALLLDRLPTDWLARCRALDVVAVDVNHRLLTAGLIDEAHAAGLRVASYTINDPARARELLAWGLDVLITDAVDRIAPDAPSGQAPAGAG
jgi:glycerophosphoryl diester phosphodiesterase